MEPHVPGGDGARVLPLPRQPKRNKATNHPPRSQAGERLPHGGQRRQGVRARETHRPVEDGLL